MIHPDAIATLPYAISTPILTGIFGLAGALIGAIAGTLPEAFFSTRRERALATAGARLITADIAAADSLLQDAERKGAWARFYKMPMENWEGNRQVLASSLDNEAFKAVSQAVMSLRFLGESMSEVPSFDDPKTRSMPIEAEHLAPVRRDAVVAYNALAKLAGHDRTSEVILPPHGGAP